MNNRVVKILFIIVLLLSMIPSLIAQESKSAAIENTAVTVAQVAQTNHQNDIFKFEDAKPMQEPDFKLILTKVMVTLFVIIAAIFGAIFVLSYILKDKKNLFNKKERYIEIIDRLHLDKSKAVYMIKIVDEVLVVGATPENMNLLSKITEQDKVNALSSREFLPLLDLFNKKLEQKGADHA